MPGKRIGVFGGAFDPPHIGHLFLASLAQRRFALDEVMWIPYRDAPQAEKAASASPADRLEMVRRAVADEPAHRVLGIELERPGPSYTVDTLRALAAGAGGGPARAEGGAAWFLLLGADQVAAFPQWRAPEEIAQRARVIAFRRPGTVETTPPVLKGRIDWCDAPALEISSRRLRKELAGVAPPARHLLPPPVWEYIAEKGLYGACR